jgi:hypothetical protein
MGPIPRARAHRPEPMGPSLGTPWAHGPGPFEFPASGWGRASPVEVSLSLGPTELLLETHNMFSTILDGDGLLQLHSGHASNKKLPPRTILYEFTQGKVNEAGAATFKWAMSKVTAWVILKDGESRTAKTLQDIIKACSPSPHTVETEWE